MIIRTELLQDSCSKILSAVDSNVLSAVTETLEITAKSGILRMAVTNREYFVDINMNIGVEDELHATVNANLFLKLVAKVTSETIELTADGNSLHIKCNGNYKIPLIYDGEELMTLPKIVIDNVNEEFDVEASVLRSLVNYNSKELQKGTISKPIQRLYYMDNQGAVTFTTGACVNKFDVTMNSKLLLSDKLVKLFKLFKDSKVKVTVGHNVMSENNPVTVVAFEAPGISISAVLSSDESMIVGFPVEAIRGRANTMYEHSVSINKDVLIQAIDRLMLFSGSNAGSDMSLTIIKMVFGSNGVVVSDRMNINHEEVAYGAQENSVKEYTAFIDSSDLTKTLASCTNQFVTFSFGNSQAFVLSEGSVKWVIPECQES